jgi:transposase
VAMEACCGAHYLGRLLAAQGHTVKLMSPEYVRPYVKAQKNDVVTPRGSLRQHRDRQCGSWN